MSDKIVSKDYDVIRYPINTEQSNRLLTAHNAYTFIVDIKANKKTIKQAVENVFDVKVLSVNTMIRKGKRKVFRGRIGKRSDIKRAIVRIEPSQKIELGMGV